MPTVDPFTYVFAFKFCPVTVFMVRACYLQLGSGLPSSPVLRQALCFVGPPQVDMKLAWKSAPTVAQLGNWYQMTNKTKSTKSYSIKPKAGFKALSVYFLQG